MPLEPEMEQPEHALDQMQKESVRDYLLDHPDFFIENSDILFKLVPPSRAMAADDVQDFQQFMLTRLQDHITSIRCEHNDLLDLMQEHLQRQNRVNVAMMELLDCDCFEATIKCVTEDLPKMLEHEVVTLFFEAGEAFPHGFYGGAQVVAEGFVDRWLGVGRDILLEETSPALAELYGDKAVNVFSHALVRLHIDDGVPPGLLAFGHKDALYHATCMATEQMESLGGVVERCVRKWLHQTT